MNDAVAIKVENLSKEFKLPHSRVASIKQRTINLIRGLKGYELQHALSEVSFEINKGEFFGIVGKNGSGKSTLLKILAGVYHPSSGGVKIDGSLVPFIELGVGFNPELSGRDNVFLNGALLGFSRSEIVAMYDEIVRFAELEDYMDQMLKNYSSGMQVRLAFSIAIRAKSDILLLDEVLAVGDEAFQRKCLNVFENYKAMKQTIILVTHDMGIVEKYCDRALMLESGVVVETGDPQTISNLYSERNRDSYIAEIKQNEKTTKNIKIELLDENGQEARNFTQSTTATIKISWSSNLVEGLGVAIFKRSGEYVFGPNTFREDINVPSGTTACEYDVKLNLSEGEYYIKVGLFGENDKDIVEFINRGPAFIVSKDKEGSSWDGLTLLEHSWRF